MDFYLQYINKQKIFINKYNILTGIFIYVFINPHTLLYMLVRSFYSRNLINIEHISCCMLTLINYIGQGNRILLNACLIQILIKRCNIECNWKKKRRKKENR